MAEDLRSIRARRSGLGLRLLLLVSSVAALSTGLALGLQDRVLSSDLRHAAHGRVDRAAIAVDLLVESHLAALVERYRAISRTPALRATLEVDDAPTLAFYAQSLLEREGAAAIVFTDEVGVVTAHAGHDELVELAAHHGGEAARLAAIGRSAVAVVAVPLDTAGRIVGWLVAVESVGPDRLSGWSELSGANLSLVQSAGSSRTDAVVREVRALGEVTLEVAIPLRDEQLALANSRRNLLAAGGVALGLAFIVSIGVARGITRPIRAIQAAAGRIGEGDFDTRVDSDRSDEIGDVARAVNDMGERLGEYRTQVEAQTRQLESSVSDLERSRGQLANAQRLAQMGSWELDLATGLIAGSDEFNALFGLPRDRKPVESSWLIERIHEDDRHDVLSAVDACLDGAATLRIDCRVVCPSLPERVMHLQAQTVDADGRSGQGLEGTIQDVTDRRRAEEQIRYLNHYDPLTGLGNRRMFQDRLEIELQQARRSGHRVGVIHVDLVRFNRINDTLGPSTGDAVLKEVADRLERTIVGPGNRSESAICRLAGDEFAIVVRLAAGGADLAIVARRLVDSIAHPYRVGEHDVVLGARAGISVYPDDGDEVEELIRNATAALSHAKSETGQGVQFYAQNMNEDALRRLMLETELRRALDRGEFELHYQPKVCLVTARVTGAEALVRWRSEDGQLISPGLFIPIAEETGLIERLGDWVMRQACEQVAAWHREGLSLPVSVNLSIQQFRRGGLGDEIRSILKESGVPPELIELEITETALMRDETDVVAELSSLRDSGIRVSLDDFGTGYSSFARLRRLPVDTLKIDRAFVVDVAANEADAELAASIVSMGRALGLSVIAEGIETEAQRDILARAGCDAMQGFLVSPAVEPEAFREIVSRRGWVGPRQPLSGDH